MFVDLEQSVVNEVKKSKYGNIFNPNYMVVGGEDAANNYARGYFTVGGEISDKAMEVLRKMTEGCDSLGGFLLTDRRNLS